MFNSIKNKIVDSIDAKYKNRANILYNHPDNNKGDEEKEIKGLGIEKKLNKTEKENKENNNKGTQENKKNAKTQEKPSKKEEKNYEEVANLFYPEMKVNIQNKNEKEVDKTNKEIKSEEYEKIGNVLYPKITNNEEIDKLKENAKEENREIERERILGHAKNFGLAALEIGSAAIPISGEAKVAEGLARVLTPKLGKIISKQVAAGTVRGTVSGGLSGSIQGLGEGINKKENIVESAVKQGVKGSASGAIEGAALGLGMGKIIQNNKVKEINDLIEKRNDWGIVNRKLSNNPNEAIEHLLKEQKGFVPKAIYKKGIGDIDFVWGDKNGGIKHIIERRNFQGYDGEAFVKSIPEIIKNGKVIQKEGHLGRKYVVNDDAEVVIRLDWNQKERKWLVTSYFKK